MIVRLGAAAALAAASVSSAALLTYRWRSGWLLLLDWTPGPLSARWPPISVPTGPLVGLTASAAISAAPQMAGWALVVLALPATYWGAVRLARRWRSPAGAPLSFAAASVAGAVAVANPFVAARVYSGQIGVLWGYAALWWLLASLVARYEIRGWRAWAAPALWLAVAAACTLHMAVIASVPVIAGYALRARRVGRRAAVSVTVSTFAAAAALTALWFVPFLIVGGDRLGSPGRREALEAFNYDGSVLELLVSTTVGGGFWRPLPPGMLLWFNLVAVVAWLLALAGFRWGAGWSRDLRLLLGCCVVVALGGVLLSRGPWAVLWLGVVESFPPAGLLREPGKWAMLALPFAACAAAAAAEQASQRRAATLVAPLVALALSAASFAGWMQLSNWVGPSTYPTEWHAARAATAADQCMVAVLGAGAYTDPGFTGGRIVADPAAGFFGPRAAVSRDPRLPGLEPKPARNSAEEWVASMNTTYLAGEPLNPLLDPETAAGAGVGWVFVNRPVDHQRIGLMLNQTGFSAVYETPRAGVWRVPGGCLEVQP